MVICLFGFQSSDYLSRCSKSAGFNKTSSGETLNCPVKTGIFCLKEAPQGHLTTSGDDKFFQSSFCSNGVKVHMDTQYEIDSGGRHRSTDFCIKELCTFMRILLYFLFLPVKMLAE